MLSAWVAIAGPSASTPSCFGSVAYVYQISTYKVSNAQYASFLNAIGATNANGVWSGNMGSDKDGGITRSSVSGSYSYTVKPGYDDKPVNFVDFYDTLRFANWLQNGQPTGEQDASTTEGGAYTISAQRIADNSITQRRGDDLPPERAPQHCALIRGVLRERQPR